MVKLGQLISFLSISLACILILISAPKLPNEELYSSLSRLNNILETKSKHSQEWLALSENIENNVSLLAKGGFEDNQLADNFIQLENQLNKVQKSFFDSNEKLVEQLNKEILYLKEEIDELQKELRNSGTHWSVFAFLFSSILGNLISFRALNKS
jgi:hypothetical protein